MKIDNISNKVIENINCNECDKNYNDNDFLKDIMGNPLYWLKIENKIMLFCGPHCSNNYAIKNLRKSKSQ